MATYRKIIHVDMDAFFASVELRDHPEYKGKPLVVGRAHSRGVVAAAGYEARRFGIHSAMSSVKAMELCPDLIFAPPRMDVYKEISAQIRTIFRQYTDLIEPVSIDEAYLDVTENKKNIVLAQDIAMLIKEEIKDTLSLTASAGVSYNKFLAKVASDMKKPDGLTVIHPDKASEVISRLSVEAFWGVGKVTAKKMHALGIFTGKDLKKYDRATLMRLFGKMGSTFFEFVNGMDDRKVEPFHLRKSVGCEHTFSEDMFYKTELENALKTIAQELEERIYRSGFQGNTLVLKIKFSDFKIISRHYRVKYVLKEQHDFFSLACRLLHSINLQQKGVRLLGLAVTNPVLESQEVAFSLQQLEIPFPPY